MPRYFKQIVKSARANGTSGPTEDHTDDFLGCLNIPIRVCGEGWDRATQGTLIRCAWGLGSLVGVWECPRGLGHLQRQCPVIPIEHPTLLGLEEVGCAGHLLGIPFSAGSQRVARFVLSFLGFESTLPLSPL